MWVQLCLTVYMYNIIESKTQRMDIRMKFQVLTLWISSSHSGDYDEYCLLGCHYILCCLADLYQLLKETFASIWVVWSFRQQVHLRCWCSSNQITCLLVLGWRDKVVREETPCLYNQLLSVHYKYIHSGWRYEITPNKDKDDYCEVSLAVSMPCRLQLCSMLGSSGSK